MSAARPIWTPSADRVERAQLTRFRRWLAERGVGEFEDVEALRRWSVERPEAFWGHLWDFVDVRAAAKGDRVLDHPERMPGARWFPEARLNFAQNLLRRDDEHPALVSWTENGRQGAWSYAELRREVGRCAAGMRAMGIGIGDRVGAYLPNRAETVIAMLAAASLGATWSSCSPDFGVQGAHDRLGQVRPRLLFAADGYRYAGSDHRYLDRVRELAARLPGLERVVVVPAGPAPPRQAELGETLLWEDFLGQGADAPDFVPLPFDHPLYILFSSGTTGLPKCMIHGAGGTLLQHLKELVLHTDLGPGDRIFYYTTCGWMMWNWLVSSLAVGATVLLYDGSPFHPRPGILWDLAERERVTVFGTSAKYLGLLQKKGVRPRESHDLAALRTVLSTGSPLLPEQYAFVYGSIADDVCLSSISGGTDIVSCFALGNPTAPVVPGELQMRGLGMAVEVHDAEGRPVVGEKGELVCTRPFPSMPVGFLDDPDGGRYRAAYFERSPGIWTHGDWVELTERGGMIFYGRSDATLNPGGVRIGTAEIYRVVEPFEELLESLVVGQRWQGDTRVVLFVRLAEGAVLDDELRERLRDAIRRQASPHHVPRKIVAVADLPRTVSGKLSELAVRRVLHGEPVDNREALANPASLELFRDLPELRS